MAVFMGFRNGIDPEAGMCAAIISASLSINSGVVRI